MPALNQLAERIRQNRAASRHRQAAIRARFEAEASIDADIFLLAGFTRNS